MRGRPVAHALVSLVLAAGALAAPVGLGAASTAVAAQSPDDFRDATTVDLVSRGAKPRHRLRLASPAGATSVAVMRQDVATKQTVSGVEQPSVPLTITADLRTTVTSVDKDGVRTISFAYENASEPELNGVGGSYLVTDRGFTSSGKFTFPPGTDTETQDALQNFASQLVMLTTPFPFAPVGVGARWKVIEHPNADGITSTRVVVYTLVERDDNHIVLRSKLRQTAAANQAIQAAGLPENATATLLGSLGSGAGDATVDLNQVLPDASATLARVEQAILVEQGTQQVQIAQTVTTNFSVTRRGSGV